MSEREPVYGEHHIKRTREPYYRIIEGNLPEIADEPRLERRPLTKTNRFFVRLRSFRK